MGVSRLIQIRLASGEEGRTADLFGLLKLHLADIGFTWTIFRRKQAQSKAANQSFCGIVYPFAATDCPNIHRWEPDTKPTETDFPNSVDFAS